MHQHLDDKAKNRWAQICEYWALMSKFSLFKDMFFLLGSLASRWSGAWFLWPTWQQTTKTLIDLERVRNYNVIEWKKKKKMKECMEKYPKWHQRNCKILLLLFAPFFETKENLTWDQESLILNLNRGKWLRSKHQRSKQTG